MKMWLTLILSLPTENATARMRAWRALKSSGAAVLRDGVYLLPDEEACFATFKTVADDILSNGGQAFILRCGDPDNIDFKSYFDRDADYAALLADIRSTFASLGQDNGPEIVKQVRKLRKTFAAIAEIDFFPGE